MAKQKLSVEIHGILIGQLRRSLHYLACEMNKYGVGEVPARARRLGFHLMATALNYPELWKAVITLLIQISPSMEQAGHREDWRVLLEKWLTHSGEESKNKSNYADRAQLHLELGRIHQLQGDLRLARRQFETSRDLFRLASNSLGRGRALGRIAYIYRLQYQLADAVEIAEEALSLLDNDDSEQAGVYSLLGSVSEDRHEYEVALKFYEQALQLRKKENNSRMIAWCLRDLGGVLRLLNRHGEAVSCLRDALHIFADIDDPVHQASAELNLGNVFLDTDQPEEALKQYRQAEVWFRKTRDLRRLAIVYSNQAIALRDVECWKEATSMFDTAIARWQELNHPVYKSSVLNDYALMYQKKGNHQMAFALFGQALKELGSIEDSNSKLETELSLHWHTVLT